VLMQIFRPCKASKMLDLEPKFVQHMCYLKYTLEARMRASLLTISLEKYLACSFGD